MMGIQSTSLFAVLTSSLLVAGCADIGNGADDEAGDDGSGDQSGGSYDSESLNAGRRNPVIIVHGCPPPPEEANSDELILTVPLVDHLVANGYRANRVFQWASAGALCGSTIAQAGELALFARDVRVATGSRQVDIVAHSMGALTARAYAKVAPSRVDKLVTVAGANHGSAIAGAGVELQAIFGAPSYEGMKEMFPPYACQGETVDAADVQFALNGCLTPIGRSTFRDETPGSVEYLSIVNALDEIIQPFDSACLDQRFLGDCTGWVNEIVAVPAGACWWADEPCPGHGRVLWDPGVMDQVLDFLTDG